MMCGKPAASFIPRWGQYFACVLDAYHTGPCQPGGKCATHGKYASATGLPPYCPKCQEVVQCLPS